MNNDNIKLNKITINGEIKTLFGWQIKHMFEFSLSSRTGIKFEFSLPNNSVINGFAVSASGEEYSAEFTANMNDDDFTLTQCADGMCIFTARGARCGDFVLTVNSIVLPDIGTAASELCIPLETIAGRSVKPLSGGAAEYRSCKVLLEFDISRTDIGGVFSPSHDIECKAKDGYIAAYAETVSGGEFVLSLKRRSELLNTAYITDGTDADRIGVYLFSLPPAEAAKGGVLCVFDAKSDGMLAAECVREIAENIGGNKYFAAAKLSGETFSDSPIKGDNIDLAELTEWMYVKSGEAGDISRVIRSFKSAVPGGEIVYVTASGRADEISANTYVPVNVLSLSHSLAEYELTEIARQSGGIYAQIRKSENHAQFVRGFLDRVLAGRLKNLSIMEYEAGTYFNLPQNIGDYRMGDVIVYTFRTNVDYPRQLFLEADGGFSDTVRFDEIIKVSDDGSMGAVFAAKVFEQLYKYIERGDIEPLSVSGFKSQAVRLSRELGVVCPETGFVINRNNRRPARSSGNIPLIRLEKAAERDAFSTDFSDVLCDYAQSAAQEKRAFVRRGVYILLALMRSDYTFISLAENENDKAAMYAAAAMRRAAECGMLDNSAAYFKLADMIIAAAGGEERFRHSAIDIGSVGFYDSLAAERVLAQREPIEISKMIMSLCA